MGTIPTPFCEQHSPVARRRSTPSRRQALDGRRGCFIVSFGRSGSTGRNRRLYQGATLMKTIASAACVLFLLGAGASAQTLDDLKKDGKNTDNILTYGMGYHQQRHSLTVSQISVSVPSGAAWAT
jgi:hypothetical protein